LGTANQRKRDKKHTEKKDERVTAPRIAIHASEKNEGRKGRCVYLEGNAECRYVFKNKEGSKEKLVVVYTCTNHKEELLYKDS
jgi:hypothetical protein